MKGDRKILLSTVTSGVKSITVSPVGKIVQSLHTYLLTEPSKTHGNLTRIIFTN
jgi:hypothetical protein